MDSDTCKIEKAIIEITNFKHIPFIYSYLPFILGVTNVTWPIHQVDHYPTTLNMSTEKYLIAKRNLSNQNTLTRDKKR